MADDPTGLAIDSIAVRTPTHNDAGEHVLSAPVSYPGRIVNELTIAYTDTGEQIASPAYAIVFTSAATDITPQSVIATTEGVQQVASVFHVRDELGRHHHTKVVFS